MDDESRQLSQERLKRMIASAPTKRDLAWAELKNGVDPIWVAQKYGFDVERMQAAKLELDRREAQKARGIKIA